MGRFNIKNQKGFSLIEVAIAGAMLIIVGGGAISVTQSSAKSKLKNDTLTAVIKYRYNLISNLRSPEAIAKTGQFNGAGCLSTRLSCGNAATVYQDMTVQDHSGQNLTDKSSPSFGFTRDMSTCTSFPSISCPFRFETQWKSVCNGANVAYCNSPQLKVKGELQVAKNLGIAINHNDYAFEVTLGQVLGTYEQSCTSLGGTYIPGNPPQCQKPMNGDCGANEVVVGYDKTAKTITCKLYFQNFFNGKSVPPDNVAIGIDTVGEPVIKPIFAQQRPYEVQVPTYVYDPSPPNPGPGDGGAGGVAGVSTDGGCGGGGDGAIIEGEIIDSF